MRLYSLTQSSACDWPATAPPFITHDRCLAASTWVDWVTESLGYPNDNVDPDDLSMLRSLASQWVENPDDPELILEWIVNNNGPVSEMVTYRVHVVEVPALQLIPGVVKGKR